MEILNRYNLRTGYDDVVWLARLAVVFAAVGGILYVEAMDRAAIWLLITAVSAMLTYVLFGEIITFDTGIEVVECFFTSQEEADKALEQYEIIGSRGLIYVLIKKEDIAL